MEDDYMMAIIPCIAEIAASDTPERVKKLRLGAVSELQRYLHHYRQLGYMPHYDGAGFIPAAYSVPEEELICWSETSLKGPLTAEGFQRYMELFKQVLPEESRRLAL